MGQPAEDLGRVYGLTQPLQLGQMTVGELASVLADAAKEAEKQVKRNILKMDTGKPLSISQRVRTAQLKQAVAGLGSITNELWKDVAGKTRAGIYMAANMAADQAMDLDFLHGMPALAITQYATVMTWMASQSAESIISRRINNISLSERIYLNGKQTIVKVAQEVERGLALQQSAKQIANRVRGFYHPDVPGGASYAAMRLGRTEINNAHHTTSIRMHQDRPWVDAFEWHLSRSHPKPDICDTIKDNGPYDKQSVPGKPHPQCFCYVVPKMPEPDEFVNNLVDGQYDDWLTERGVTC